MWTICELTLIYLILFSMERKGFHFLLTLVSMRKQRKKKKILMKLFFIFVGTHALFAQNPSLIWPRYGKGLIKRYLTTLFAILGLFYMIPFLGVNLKCNPLRTRSKSSVCTLLFMDINLLLHGYLNDTNIVGTKF